MESIRRAKREISACFRENPRDTVKLPNSSRRKKGRSQGIKRKVLESSSKKVEKELGMALRCHLPGKNA